MLCLGIACTPKVQTVKKEHYDWKYFGENPNYQRVDLSQYISPNEREGQDTNFVVIVCSSGGGTRAATFTVGVMLELERMFHDSKEPSDNAKNILNEVDYLSTTSGGGWGAASYIAYLYRHEPKYPTYNSFETYLANWADRKINRYQFWYAIPDFINDHFREDKDQISSGVIMQNRVNWGYLGGYYRKQKFNDENPITLSDVFTLQGSGKKPRLPMIIANTTNIDNFMLIPFTPDRLQYWGISQYSTNTFELVPNEYKPSKQLPLSEILDIPLSAGISASGSVPGVVGTSYFYCNKPEKDGIKRGYYLRLHDGGLIDNQALHVTKTILEYEQQKNPKTKKIVIMIDASTANGIRTERPQKKNKRRSGGLFRITRQGLVEGPYPLMREALSKLGSLYGCQVIHLSLEALLDNKLGLTGKIPESFTYNKQEAEKVFNRTYRYVLKDSSHYATYISMKERATLYNYIEKYVPSYMLAKGSNSDGLYVEDDPNDVKGSTKIMFLAGRAVVQLNKDSIRTCFNLSP